jgi:hypothetical protein
VLFITEEAERAALRDAVYLPVLDAFAFTE